MSRLSIKLWYFITQTIYKGKFHSIGKGSVIYKPLQFNQIDSVSIGNKVFIAEGSWLIGNKNETCTLQVGDGSTIGHFVHIVAERSVTIGENVLIADKVFISDADHGYKDISIPIQNQNLEIKKPVSIGEGSWLGDNVSVCGASIGRHCVIGTNSVVVKDIPDFCIAAGNPAKIIKKYNFETNQWEKYEGI